MIGIELHVSDFVPVRDFYPKLGFREVRQEKNYLVMQLEDNLINFYGGAPQIYQHQYFKRFPSNTQPGYGVEVIITIQDLRGVYDKARQIGCIQADLQDRAWGAKDFRVADPFGYYLRFTTPYTL